MAKEFESEHFFVTAHTEADEPAAEIAAKVLDYYADRFNDWATEAFRAAIAESPGHWPSAAALKQHFERIAREAIQAEMQSDDLKRGQE